MPVTDWTQTTYSNNCGGAQTMAADPTDPNKVYLVVGTYGSTAGFLRSTDGGRTWLRTDVSGIDVDGNGWGRGLGERIAVDPNSPISSSMAPRTGTPATMVCGRAPTMPHPGAKSPTSPIMET